MTTDQTIVMVVGGGWFLGTIVIYTILKLLGEDDNGDALGGAAIWPLLVIFWFIYYVLGAPFHLINLWLTRRKGSPR